MLYREYVDYDLNHESSLYGHKDLYQCCATDPEIQREEPKGEPVYYKYKRQIREEQEAAKSMRPME